MLYLAQVHKNEFLDQHQLRLLARQEADSFWAMIPEEAFILLGKSNTPEARVPRQFGTSEAGATPAKPSRSWDFRVTENLLVLVELSPTGDIERLEDATNWVLNLVQTYLTTGISPEFLRLEAERAEQWRQNLTLQNQDLARRSLELEARREQIQALEEGIKREKNSNQKDEDAQS